MAYQTHLIPTVMHLRVPATRLADATDVAAAWTEFAKGHGTRPREITIPRRYNRNSTLRVEVTAQTAKALDFKLASK
ncbi:MAG TPA: hypothetical protein VG055_33860 [Planctomycetaceae bacterium]|jgi:hypothetical protein|nr:hypothetical protein [Planctomycetaceae bacterium]